MQWEGGGGKWRLESVRIINYLSPIVVCSACNRRISVLSKLASSQSERNIESVLSNRFKTVSNSAILPSSITIIRS